MDENEQRVNKQSIYGTTALIIIGIVVNYLLSQLVLALKIPLFLDSLGTIITTLLGGTIPGMFAGFFVNLFSGFSDTITLYYGIISVILALATRQLAIHGWFDSLKRAWVPTIVLAFIGGVIGSCLTWLLYGQGIGEGISSPYARALLNIGVSEFLAQLIADTIIDIIDKWIVVVLSICIVKKIPQKIYKYLPYRLINKTENDEIYNYRRFSLRTKMAVALIINSISVGGAAIWINSIRYRNDMILQFTNQFTGVVNMELVNSRVLIFLMKNISFLFGVELVVAMLILAYCDLKIIDPINRMTVIADMFAFNDEEKKKTAERLLKESRVKTGDELESLFMSLRKMTVDTNAYIDHIHRDMDYISKLQEGMIQSFADMVENRDDNTGQHIKRTASYVEIIANSLMEEGKYKTILTKEYATKLIQSAPLHDIGKIKIPDSILNKPGKLTEEEFNLMKTHTTSGKEILERVATNIGEVGYLATAIEIAESHHEWWNGKGYPDGLKANAIPLSARIMAVADVYDALVSKRSYKDAYSYDKAFTIIQEESGTHFDPVVVDAFLAARKDIMKID